MKIIDLDNISFGYTNHLILENVNLSIYEKEFAAIVGQNGSGKTTLIKLILGLITPRNGSIKVFGNSPQQERINIGYMPQNINYDPDFPITAMDIVLMGRHPKKMFQKFDQKDYQAAIHSLQDLQILDLKDKNFSDLSGGQRRRVMIARALACNPKLLILDEPMANVDPLIEGKFLDLLKKLNEKMAIIMVSHNIHLVADIVKKVICVDKQVAVHPTREITKELFDEITKGYYKMVNHDACEHSER